MFNTKAVLKDGVASLEGATEYEEQVFNLFKHITYGLTQLESMELGDDGVVVVDYDENDEMIPFEAFLMVLNAVGGSKMTMDFYNKFSNGYGLMLKGGTH